MRAPQLIFARPMLDPHLRERPRLPAFEAYLPPGAAAIRALAPHSCHWPLGDVEADGFRFCAAPARVGRAYCAEHGRLARRGRR